jgi:hypothetical protein
MEAVRREAVVQPAVPERKEPGLAARNFRRTGRSQGSRSWNRMSAWVDFTGVSLPLQSASSILYLSGSVIALYLGEGGQI